MFSKHIKGFIWFWYAVSGFNHIICVLSRQNWLCNKKDIKEKTYLVREQSSCVPYLNSQCGMAILKLLMYSRPILVLKRVSSNNNNVKLESGSYKILSYNMIYIRTIKHLAVVEGTQWIIFYISLKKFELDRMRIIRSNNLPCAHQATEK